MTTPWKVIKDRLVAEGDMTERNVTRTPKPRICRSCGRNVIAAITDCGFEVAVDPEPTTATGELATLLAGGETYALLDHGEMVWRDPRRIAYATPDRERTHARHRCGKAPPEVNPVHAPKQRRRAVPDNQIPF